MSTFPTTEAEWMQTISGRVRVVIEDAAAKASLRPLLETWSRSRSREEVMSKVRMELWQTPEGRALRELDRTIGSKPYTTSTVAEIRKSNTSRFSKALEVLEHGFPLHG